MRKKLLKATFLFVVIGSFSASFFVQTADIGKWQNSNLDGASFSELSQGLLPVAPRLRVSPAELRAREQMSVDEIIRLELDLARMRHQQQMYNMHQDTEGAGVPVEVRLPLDPRKVERDKRFGFMDRILRENRSQ